MIGPFEEQNVSAEAGATGTLLALGVERRVLRACLLEPIAGHHHLIGWISVQRDPGSELTHQLAIVCRRLGARLGRPLWDEAEDAPFIASKDPLRYPPIDQVLAASTPRDLLRVWIAGLSPQDSIAAARTAANAAPARVVGVTALDATIDIAELARRFSADRPDILVVTGGYDNPDPNTERPIYQLTGIMCELLRRLPPGERPAIVYAGDRWMAPYCVDRLQAVSDTLLVEVVANLRPSPTLLHTAPLASMLTERQWDLAQRMPGFIRLGRWVTKPARIMSMEANFTQATRAWMEVERLSSIHGLYFASNWRLHVLAEAGSETVRMRYVEERTLDPQLAGWPPVTLVSGLPPGDALRLAPRWWDRSGMLPVVASVGQLAPEAMIHTMRHDLLAEQVNEI